MMMINKCRGKKGIRFRYIFNIFFWHSIRFSRINSNTDDDPDKYITSQEFNNLSAKNFRARSTQASLTRKNDISNFVKKTDFDNKPKKLNKNVTSNETKPVLVKKKLNELTAKVKAILTRGLTKDLIHKSSIIKGAKYFFSGIFQNYLVVIPTKKHIKCFSGFGNLCFIRNKFRSARGDR